MRSRRPAARSATLLATILFAGPASAEVPVLECRAAFAKNVDEAALVRRFGRENVVAADLDGAEGATERGTVLFPKDPSRRVEIFWHDGERRRRPASVVVSRPSTWVIEVPGSPGRTIGPGATLETVEEANGRPFAVTGFGWDMGGYGAGWKGGRLEKLDGGCFLSVRFDPDPKAKGIDKVSGDRQFNSTAAALRSVKPVVNRLSVDWPE